MTLAFGLGSKNDGFNRILLNVFDMSHHNMVIYSDFRRMDCSMIANLSDYCLSLHSDWSDKCWIKLLTWRIVWFLALDLENWLLRWSQNKLDWFWWPQPGIYSKLYSKMTSPQYVIFMNLTTLNTQNYYNLKTYTTIIIIIRINNYNIIY